MSSGTSFFFSLAGRAISNNIGLDTGEAPAVRGGVPAVRGGVPAVRGEVPAVRGGVPAARGN